MGFVKIFAHLCSTQGQGAFPGETCSLLFCHFSFVSRKCSILTAPRKVPQQIPRISAPGWWLCCVCASLAALDTDDPDSCRFLSCFFITCSFPWACFGRENFRTGCAVELPLRYFCSCHLPSLHPRNCCCWDNKCASWETQRMSTKPPL